MDVQFKVLVGSAVGQKINVAGPKFYVGRAEDCQLRPRSDLISRHHCAVIIEDDYVAIRDFGSRNGTFVNDQRVSGERQLNNGDKLVIGPLEFEVCLVQTSAGLGGKKRPKVTSVKEAAVRTAESVGFGSDSSVEEDVDISQWIGDSGEVTVGETRELATDAAETQELKMDLTEAAVSDETERGQAAGSARKGKKEPGKLPKLPQSSDSTDSAAAEMLKKLRRYR